LDQLFKSPYFKAYFWYLGLVVFSISAYAGNLYNGPKTMEFMLSNSIDFLLTVAIMVIGWLFIRAGAHAPGVTAIGALGSFFALTLAQNDLVRYLTLSALLFAIGMYGMVKSRNAVRVLMSIELMLNAVNINLVAFARYIDPAQIKGQLFAIFILTVAAAEAAVGLAIVLAVYRNTSTVDMNRFNLLKF